MDTESSANDAPEGLFPAVEKTQQMKNDEEVSQSEEDEEEDSDDGGTE